jgi:hypothetical protein
LIANIRYTEKKYLKLTVKIWDLGENDTPFKNPGEAPGHF